jgi:glycine cleavage system H protein
MTEMRFTEQHEWIRVEGDEAFIGITNYAQEQLGDVVFVELPEVGKEVAQFAEAAVVESVKAASEIYSPASGQIIEVNEKLSEEPALVNSDATGGGWFIKLKLFAPSEVENLLTQDAYDKYLGELD